MTEDFGFRMFLTSRDIWRRMQGSVLVVKEELIKKHPEIVRKLVRVVIGFCVGSIAGLIIGTFMGWKEILNKTFSPIISLVYPIPALVWPKLSSRVFPSWFLTMAVLLRRSREGRHFSLEYLYFTGRTPWASNKPS